MREANLQNQEVNYPEFSHSTLWHITALRTLNYSWFCIIYVPPNSVVSWETARNAPHFLCTILAQGLEHSYKNLSIIFRGNFSFKYLTPPSQNISIHKLVLHFNLKNFNASSHCSYDDIQDPFPSLLHIKLLHNLQNPGLCPVHSTCVHMYVCACKRVCVLPTVCLLLVGNIQGLFVFALLPECLAHKSYQEIEFTEWNDSWNSAVLLFVELDKKSQLFSVL